MCMCKCVGLQVCVSIRGKGLGMLREIAMRDEPQLEFFLLFIDFFSALIRFGLEYYCVPVSIDKKDLFGKSDPFLVFTSLPVSHAHTRARGHYSTESN